MQRSRSAKIRCLGCKKTNIKTYSSTRQCAERCIKLNYVIQKFVLVHARCRKNKRMDHVFYKNKLLLKYHR